MKGVVCIFKNKVRDRMTNLLHRDRPRMNPSTLAPITTKLFLDLITINSVVVVYYVTIVVRTWVVEEMLTFGMLHGNHYHEDDI